MTSPLDPLMQLVRWLRPGGNGTGLSRQISVQLSSGAHGERTRVSIDHRIPGDADEGRPGLRITTKEQKLFRAHFDREVRDAANSASHERGRRMYCIDVSRQEVIAVLTYHIDDRAQFPVLITTIGQRIDGDADMTRLSRAAAALLKQYVHQIAQKIGRGGFVDFDNGDAAAESELKTLGFRRGPKVDGRRPSGTMWRQDALSE